MTLTSAQRGDVVEGWNDCPVPVAGSASRAKSRRSRVYHSSNMPQLSSPDSSAPATIAPSPSATPNPNPAVPNTAVPSTPIPSTPATSAPIFPSTSSNESEPSPVETKSDGTTPVEAVDLLEKVLTSRSLSEKEMTFYKTKIPVSTLSPDHQQFVAKLLQRVVDGDNQAAVKKELVSFMMCNDGVSTWCSALKKLIS